MLWWGWRGGGLLGHGRVPKSGVETVRANLSAGLKSGRPGYQPVCGGNLPPQAAQGIVPPRMEFSNRL